MTGSLHRVFLLVATLVVSTAVVVGFVIVGTPDARRQERMDERRLDDLRAIHLEILYLVRMEDDATVLKRALPATLDELLSLARRRRLTLTDPETGARYDYRVIDDRRYELCATFARPRDSGRSVFWDHPAGRHCFVIDALDPP